MAHKTLIGGTAYEIGGGRTLIGGTGYDIAGGRTLVGGTGYDISFGPPLSSFWFYSNDTWPEAIPLTEYYFEDGMTWADFIASSYNTDSVFSGSYLVKYDKSQNLKIKREDKTGYDTLTDTIVSGATYKGCA